MSKLRLGGILRSYLYFLCISMIRDTKYDGIREAFEKGTIKKFEEIVDILKKTNVADIICVNNNRVTAAITQPWILSTEENILLSDFLQIDDVKLYKLLASQYRKAAKGSKTKLPIERTPKKKKRKTE